MGFQVHTAETAPKATLETLQTIQERYGFIPNLAGVFAESPAALKGLLSAIQAYDDEAMTLSPLERQVVLVAVASENCCDYCTAAHSMLASNLGMDREQIDRLQRQETLDDPRLEALRAITTSVVRNRGRVAAEKLDAFLAEGFDRGQLLEILLGVSLKTLTNYANHIADVDVNPEFSAFLSKRQNAAQTSRLEI